MTVSCVQTEPLPTATISAGMKDAPLEMQPVCIRWIRSYSHDKTDDTLVFVNSKEDGEIERLYVELCQ